mmetsp:Transcript_18542/g.29884  ORF Transcript_18542/g.29884 Transcript_18542/m.29884 type:complete len:112 (+) Transcript_18542:167-502(+)
MEVMAVVAIGTIPRTSNVVASILAKEACNGLLLAEGTLKVFEIMSTNLPFLPRLTQPALFLFITCSCRSHFSPKARFTQFWMKDSIIPPNPPVSFLTAYLALVQMKGGACV